MLTSSNGLGTQTFNLRNRGSNPLVSTIIQKGIYLMTNTNMANVVMAVAELLEKFSVAEVEHALQYVRTYPTVTSMESMPPLIELHNPRGTNFKLTQREYNRLLETIPHINKINAIKVLRDITRCSLADAKETVEYRWY